MHQNLALLVEGQKVGSQHGPLVVVPLQGLSPGGLRRPSCQTVILEHLHTRGCMSQPHGLQPNCQAAAPGTFHAYDSSALRWFTVRGIHLRVARRSVDKGQGGSRYTCCGGGQAETLGEALTWLVVEFRTSTPTTGCPNNYRPLRAGRFWHGEFTT